MAKKKESPVYSRVCSFCGSTFETTATNKRYCSESCYREAMRKRQAQYRETHIHKQRHYVESALDEKEKKKRRGPKSAMDEWAEAKRNGCTLSYGKWQAQRWMKEQKENKQ